MPRDGPIVAFGRALAALPPVAWLLAAAACSEPTRPEVHPPGDLSGTLDVASRVRGRQPAGTERTVRVRAVDAQGAPLAGVEVEWHVVSGGGTVGAETELTDADGRASAVWTLGPEPGPQRVEGVARALDSAAVTFTVTALPAGTGIVLDVVRDFGAVADATTDNEPMIQAALDSAMALGGGTVYLPEGTYGIAQPLIVRSRVHLMGAGRSRTVLRSVAGNLVSNVGGAGLNFGSAGLADSGINGLRVTGNRVTNAAIGVNIGTATGPAGPQNVVDARIEDNDLSSLWRTGVSVPAMAGTEVRGLVITGNRIRAVGSDATPGAGVYFQGDEATATAPATAAADNVVSGNVIEDVRGHDAFGVLVLRYPNVTLAENAISGIGHSGVYAFAADSLIVERNQVDQTGYFGIQSGGAPSRIYIRDNTFRDWNREGAGPAGVSISDAAAGEVRRNAFEHESTPPAAVRVQATAANIVVFGNRLLSDSVTPGDESLRVTFTAPARGGEAFRYEIDP